MVSFDVIAEGIIIPDSEYYDHILERVRTFAFQDIDDSIDEFSVGWVSILNMFDSEFSDGSHRNGEYVTLAVRVDERKVPPAILEKFVVKEELRVKQEKQIPKLSRSMRADIKARVATELFRKAEPSASVFEIVWDVEKNVVLAFTTDKKKLAILEDLFLQCFEMHIRQRIPYTIAENSIVLLSLDLVSKLEDVKECSFIAGNAGRA